MNNTIDKHFLGGLLLTGMLFMFLFSFILTITIIEFKETQQFTTATVDYYKARIMVLFLLKNLPKSGTTVSIQGEQVYNEGHLVYQIRGNHLEIVVTVGTHVYQFKEARPSEP